MQYSEIELISEIKKKNPSAFDCMISQYTKPVYYLTYNILNIGNSKEDIEECVTDVFVDAWNKIEQYDPLKGCFRKWLLMLTKYRALTYKRKLEKHPVDYLEDYVAHELPEVQTPLLDWENQQMLADVIATFSELDRQLFIRRYYLDEPISTFMEAMNLSRPSIDNRLMRCRNKIKEALSCG
ncbi:MAG: sigma-70 family RNA polymerase sigma factor [Oscillospiraceae bacterium]